MFSQQSGKIRPSELCLGSAINYADQSRPREKKSIVLQSFKALEIVEGGRSSQRAKDPIPWPTLRWLAGLLLLHCAFKIQKKISLLLLQVALLLKPLVIRFCPLKILSDSFSSFYTVNIQNLKEPERIYKGQKWFTKGFLEINVARFARKNETFLAFF